MHRISPSSLTFSYSDCKCCWYHEAKGIWKKPRSPMPGVFNRIDTEMRKALHGQSLQLLSADLPVGIISTLKKRSQSKPIASPKAKNSIVISGEMDATATLPDGSVRILDFKVSRFRDDLPVTYAPQFHGYAEMVRSPSEGVAREVSGLHIICLDPDFMTTGEGIANLQLNMHAIDVPLDWNWWDEFLLEVASILDSNIPPEGRPNCPYCQLRQYQQADRTPDRLGQLVHEEIGHLSKDLGLGYEYVPWNLAEGDRREFASRLGTSVVKEVFGEG